MKAILNSEIDRISSLLILIAVFAFPTKLRSESNAPPRGDIVEWPSEFTKQMALFDVIVIGSAQLVKQVGPEGRRFAVLEGQIEITKVIRGKPDIKMMEFKIATVVSGSNWDTADMMSSEYGLLIKGNPVKSIFAPDDYPWTRKPTPEAIFFLREYQKKYEILKCVRRDSEPVRFRDVELLTGVICNAANKTDRLIGLLSDDPSEWLTTSVAKILTLEKAAPEKRILNLESAFSSLKPKRQASFRYAALSATSEKMASGPSEDGAAWLAEFPLLLSQLNAATTIDVTIARRIEIICGNLIPFRDRSYSIILQLREALSRSIKQQKDKTVTKWLKRASGRLDLAK